MNKLLPPVNQFGKSILILLAFFLHSSLFAQPDLVVVESALINSLTSYTLNNNDQCYVNEGCVSGIGLRQILRFTTHIKNVGNQDFYVGAPPANPADENEVWEYDECHGHWHYEGYAEYVLFDQDGNQLPMGFKNGFCLIDIECSGGGNFTYTCSNQGIAAGCGDIYGSGLDCQWVDVTDLPDGIYKLMIRVNWDEDPDALGNYESNYTNNTGEVCFDLTTDANGTAAITVIGNGTSCSGTACHDVTVTVNLDNYPAETAWEIRNTENTVIISSNGTYSAEPQNSTVSQTVCLPEGCYDFVITDSYGDGICCAYGDGSYQLTDPSGNVVAEGGQFTSSETTNFCVGPPPSCADADDDGICAADDCDDENAAVPAPPGASCNDGDPNTIDDEIQSDGCSCAGSAADDCSVIHILTSSNTITVEHIAGFAHPSVKIFNSGWGTVSECLDNCGDPHVVSNLPAGIYHVQVKAFNSSWQTVCEILETVSVTDGPCPDNDGDGVCQAVDCDDNNANLPTTVGSTCNDGNPNTNNDVIQSDGCTCAGVVPCTDNDNDGVCADDDCDDNNSSLPTTPGTTCNDGNPDTDNDVIQSDGCTCQGIDTSCTDNDNDGTCQADDCNDNDASIPATPGTACNDGNTNTSNDVIQADGCTCQGESSNGCDAVIMSGPGSITISNLSNPNVSVQIFNSSWATVFSCFNDCDNPQVIALPEDTYYVKVNLWDANWQAICLVDEYVTVTGGCTAGQPCNDNDPCTSGETYDADCNCNGGTAGPDNDNDGVCLAIDCNDNDPNVPTTPGSSCDDGNVNTTNDVIQNDGCSCQGVPIGGGNCLASHSVTDGALVVSGITAPNVIIKVFETSGWSTVFECFNTCSDPLIIADLPDGEYYLNIQTWDSGWQSICTESGYVTINGNSGLESEDSPESLFFLATKDGRAVNINWVVSNSEDHTDYFVVERSKDAVNFNEIQTIESLNNRDGNFNYQANDHEPFYGANFYRLKLVNYDATFIYSEIRRVEVNTHWEDFSLFPNPTNSSVLINLAKYDGMSGNIMLVDQLGQTRQTITLDRISKKPIKMDVQEMPAGLYFIYLKVDGRKAVSKKLMIAE